MPSDLSGYWPPSRREAEPPLAVGSVYGVRDWGYRKGRLVPVAFSVGSLAGAWVDGENIAKCYCIRQSGFGPACVRQDERCGFYAYHHPGWRVRSAVTGVIQGYGTTVVGSRGFRCQKAKIVALCVPRVSNRLMQLVAQRPKIGIPLLLTGLVAWATLLVLPILTGYEGVEPYVQPFLSVGAGLWLGRFLGMTAGARRNDTVDVEALRRRYPNAVIYRSKWAMYARYGLAWGLTPPGDITRKTFARRRMRYEP